MLSTMSSILFSMPHLALITALGRVMQESGKRQKDREICMLSADLGVERNLTRDVEKLLEDSGALVQEMLK